MASSIIGGLLKNGQPVDTLSAADPFPESLERLRAIAPVSVHSDNAQAASNANVIILAVKPQVMTSAVDSIAATVKNTGAVVISIAAGITIESLQRGLGQQAAIVRCMPNTPALVGYGASGLYANEQTSAEQRQQAQHILNAVGMTQWLAPSRSLMQSLHFRAAGPPTSS